MSQIRPAIVSDLPGVYRVCLLTGDSGKDATAIYRDPDLLGHLYVGPYLVGHPDFAFVVVDPAGVAGYTLAVPDTRAFEEWAEREWWPPLRKQHALADEASPDADLIRTIHDPPVASHALLAEYPAHLHIDLLPRLQGKGYGRRLIELMIDRLCERGCTGVHLGVGVDNDRAIAFYEHLGFHPITREPGELVMGVKLT